MAPRPRTTVKREAPALSWAPRPRAPLPSLAAQPVGKSHRREPSLSRPELLSGSRGRRERAPWAGPAEEPP